MMTRGGGWFGSVQDEENQDGGTIKQGESTTKSEERQGSYIDVFRKEPPR